MEVITVGRKIFHVSAHNLDEWVVPVVPLAVALTLRVLTEYAECDIAGALLQL